MGSGIAQVAAMSGYDVILQDVGEAELERGLSAIDSSLARFSKSGKLADEEVAAVRNRIATTTSLEDAVRAAAVVVEAVPEILELKQEVLVTVAGAAPEDALLGTNTSQLSITTIGVPLGAAASRLVGTHFFNPPVMMALVELVRGLATSDETFASGSRVRGEPRQDGGRLQQGQPGLHHHPCIRRPAARMPADARGGDRVTRGHRHRPQARIQLPDGAARAR